MLNKFDKYIEIEIHQYNTHTIKRIKKSSGTTISKIKISTMTFGLSTAIDNHPFNCKMEVGKY